MEPLDPIFLERLERRYQEAVGHQRTPRFDPITGQPTNRPTPVINARIDPRIEESNEHGFWSRLVRFPARIINALRRTVSPTLPDIKIDRDNRPILINSADNTDIELQVMATQIDELREALTQVKKQLAEASQAKMQQASTFHVVAYNVTEDCAHWQQLLDTHIKVVRVLEVKNAQMGINLPTFEKIELEERRVRVGELQKSLRENCSDG